MKVENATIGTRVIIAKDLSDSKLGGLYNAVGKAGVIVEYENAEAVTVRFDEKFRRTGDLEGRYWVVYIADLELE